MKDKSVAKPTAEFPYKKSGQMVGKMRADLLRRRFTETSPGFRAFSLETLRYCDGEMTVIFDPSFVLLPRTAQYTRKSPVQFDIPSSYLYVVVLKELCL